MFTGIFIINLVLNLCCAWTRFWQSLGTQKRGNKLPWKKTSLSSVFSVLGSSEQQIPRECSTSLILIHKDAILIKGKCIPFGNFNFNLENSFMR